MKPAEARQIIIDAIKGFGADNLIRIDRRNGTANSFVIKEKKPSNTTDITKIENVIAACKLKGLIYKGIGVGFDYNSNEYTMVLSFN